MGTSYTANLVYGWKVQLGDLRHDLDSEYMPEIPYDGEGIGFAFTSSFLEHSDVFFGYGYSAGYGERYVSGFQEHENVAESLREAIANIEHDGLKIAVLAAVKNVPVWHAIITVS